MAMDTYEHLRDDVTQATIKYWLMVKQVAKRILKERNFSVTFEQLMVLGVLRDHSGLDLGSLAEHCDRERTTTSRMIDNLEERNMVHRVTDKQDARRKLVFLSQAGHQQLEKANELVGEFDSILYWNVSPEDIQVTIKTLETVIANMDAYKQEHFNKG